MRKFILLFTFVLIAIAPTMAKAQSITTGAVTGTITACAGSASMSPNLQEFTISATGISGFLTAVAPPNFEVAPAANGPFAPNVMLPTTNGTAAGTIYVRSAATAPLGSISGVVNVTALGASTQMVTVSGQVNALPVVNPVGNQVLNVGQQTAPVSFSGSAKSYKWEVDKPEIGISANGSGDISAFTAKNTTNAPIIATVKVTPVPEGMLYVANPGSNSVSIVNTATNSVVATVPLGISPNRTAVTPDGKKVYIQSNLSNSIYVLDAATNVILKTIPVGNNAGSLTLSPDGTRLYLLIPTDNSVVVINTTNDTVITTITGISNYPQKSVISNDGKFLYVTTFSNSLVYIINTTTNSVEGSLSTSTAITGILVSPDGSKLYLINGGVVSIVNLLTRQQQSQTNLGGATASGVLSADGTRLYIPGDLFRQVTVIDALNGSIIHQINTGQDAREVVVGNDGNYIYVSNYVSKSLSVISTVDYSIVTTIPLSGANGSLIIDRDRSRIYVTDADNKSLHVINTITNGVIANVAVGGNPLISTSSIGNGNGCAGMPINFTITVKPAAQPTTIISSGSISNLQTTFGKPSPSQSFTVSGTALTAGILVTPPWGFEVSSDNINFSSTVTVGTAGTVASTPVYVRLASTTNANTYSGDIVLSSTGAANVNVPIANSTVLPVTLTITGGYPKTYGEQLSNYTLYYNDPYISFDDSKFVNGNTFYSVDINFMAGMAKTTPVGTYQNAVVLSALKGANGFLASNYDVHYDPLPLIVDPADLTITAKNVTKPFGQTKATETGSQNFSSSPLQNGETVGSVTINYGAGAVANAAPGTYPGSVIPSGATGGTFDPHNYQIVYAPGNLIVSASTLPTITSTGTPTGVNTVFGTSSSSSSFNVSGINLSGSILVTSPPGFEVSTNNSTYSPTVTLTGGTTIPNTPVYIRLSSLTNAGTYNGDIVLSSAGATAIKVFMPDSKVDKATLQVQAPYVDKTYGEVLTTRNVGPDGFSFGGGTSLKNGNKIDVVILTYGAGAAANADVRRYTGAITVTILSTSGNFLPDNYNIVFIPGYIEVTRAPLTIELNPVDKTYGSALTGGPGYTDFKVTGLKNQETVGSITVQYVKGAAANDPVGPYVASLVGSAVTGGTYKAANYQPARYISGTLTIKPATLTITADNKARRYLEENPPLSYTYSGFVNGENASIVSAAPTVSTTATVASSVGKYPITLSRNAVAPNYKIDYADALLSITRTGGMALKFPNTFTPNGDGVNDTWLLTDLEDYPNCVVKIYTRYGQEVFNSVGYSAPWAGTYKGANVPNGVYYYVIDPKDKGKVMLGSVTVIR